MVCNNSSIFKIKEMPVTFQTNRDCCEPSVPIGCVKSYKPKTIYKCIAELFLKIIYFGFLYILNKKKRLLIQRWYGFNHRFSTDTFGFENISNHMSHDNFCQVARAPLINMD